MDGFASYDGSSWFLRWWPKILLGLALWVLVIGWDHSIQWATFFVLCAWAHGRLLPWRFVVFDEGLLLVFPFGRRVFLPKVATTVRLESVGAVASASHPRTSASTATSRARPPICSRWLVTSDARGTCTRTPPAMCVWQASRCPSSSSGWDKKL